MTLDVDQFPSLTLPDRTIEAWQLFRIITGVSADARVLPLSTQSLSGNGRPVVSGNTIAVGFCGGDNAYQIRLDTGGVLVANGVSVRLRLRGWRSVRYLAIGYTHENAFRHVKVTNPVQDKWTDYGFGHRDIAFGLQNDWNFPGDTPIRDIRVYIRATPDSEGSFVDMEYAACFRESESPPKWVFERTQPHTVISDVVSTIYSYIEKSFARFSVQADSFVQHGQCPLFGDVCLDWPLDQELPTSLGNVGTYRFSWHALHPVMMLLLHARRTKQLGPLFSARDLVTEWMNRSYFKPDQDKKFAWYDHGTAERQLALILMWHLGHEQCFDSRFMKRLQLLIFRHGQLLASETFYASHQPSRYHNHAWFQDIALFATSSIMRDFPCAAAWRRIAIERLEDQLEQLIVRDNGYAVFNENSMGYHQGVQRLLEFAGELVSLSGRESPITAVATELSRFSEFLRYPDGRAPSFGDTYRRSNAPLPRGVKRRDVSITGLTVLSKAGYAIVKGHHEDSTYVLTVIAPSLNRTHKHEDNLSFSLYFDGVEWLIDPSFYSHEYASPIPAYLRSAAAHNALVIPGREYSIEPGVARIDGQELPGDEFCIAGEHRSYAGIVVKRRFSGCIDALDFSVDDLALEEEQISAAHDRLCLMFHCGEGVYARIAGSVVVLSHPASRYEIALQLPHEAIVLQFGEKSASKVRGVAGLGFMQLSDIVTIESELAWGQTYRWRLRAVKTAEQV